MTDSTHTPRRRSPAQALHRAAIIAAIVTLTSGSFVSLARADGDPASDVLLTQNLYLPQDANVPGNQQAQLGAVLRSARRSDYQLRVALIASPADLGSITGLWRQPENYARFLGQELSLNYRGPLLVVMPNGYGLYRVTGPHAAEASALTGAGAPGAHLGTAALTAIQRLAAANGHRLTLPNATAPGGPSPADTIPWLVFGIGSALIVLAWTASLRARPLRSAETKPTST